MPIQTKAILQGHLAKVRDDLADAMQATASYYLRAEEDGEPGRAAFEALIRAVSTITLVLEDQEQRRVPCMDMLCTREHETRQSGPTLAAYHLRPVADIGCGDPTHMVPR